MFPAKKFFSDYNLVILKEIVIMADISNPTVVDFIEKRTSNYVKNFVSVFPSTYVTRFITFHSMHSMMTDTGA